jgi:hypothetical protein
LNAVIIPEGIISNWVKRMVYYQKTTQGVNIIITEGIEQKLEKLRGKILSHRKNKAKETLPRFAINFSSNL